MILFNIAWLAGIIGDQVLPPSGIKHMLISIHLLSYSSQQPTWKINMERYITYLYGRSSLCFKTYLVERVEDKVGATDVNVEEEEFQPRWLITWHFRNERTSGRQDHLLLWILCAKLIDMLHVRNAWYDSQIPICTLVRMKRLAAMLRMNGYWQYENCPGRSGLCHVRYSFIRSMWSSVLL